MYIVLMIMRKAKGVFAAERPSSPSAIERSGIARPVQRKVGHQVPVHVGLPEAWLEKNVMTWPAGSRTVKTS
jgi:hypothetical protein